jgi:hypothetical protein
LVISKGKIEECLLFTSIYLHITPFLSRVLLAGTQQASAQEWVDAMLEEKNRVSVMALGK